MVLQRLEQPLGIRVVIAHGRAAEPRYDAKRLQGREHRCAFHRLPLSNAGSPVYLEAAFLPKLAVNIRHDRSEIEWPAHG